jgi:hypothetical protein
MLLSLDPHGNFIGDRLDSIPEYLPCHIRYALAARAGAE